MTCKGFKSLKGCGKCNILLSDNKSLSKLSTKSINHLLCTVIDISRQDTNAKLLSEESTITCTGKFTALYINSNKSDTTKHNRIICRDVLIAWFKSHKSEISHTITTMYLCIALSSLLDKRSDSQSSRNISDFCSIVSIVSNISID